MYRLLRLQILPTRVNREHVLGPILHYDRITDEEAARLGLATLPGTSLRSAIRRDGVTARRLSCGRLNVTIEPGAAILREPPPRTSARDGSQSGLFTVDTSSWCLELSPGALELGRRLNPELQSRSHFFQHCTRIHKDDLYRVLACVSAAVAGGKEESAVYRIEQTLVRSWWRPIEKDESGRALRLAGGITALTTAG